MQYLFQLLYTCRTQDGALLMTEEECGAKVCLDAGTNPLNSEVTYQVRFRQDVARGGKGRQKKDRVIINEKKKCLCLNRVKRLA